jgi:hypothetical protein
MKTDKYTKVLLTIIAICLINIAFGDLQLLPRAHAGAPEGPGPAAYGLVPLNKDGSITVKLSALEEIDVNIKGIDTWDELKVDIADISTSEELEVNLAEISTTDELDINIDQVGGGQIMMGGPIKVKSDN